jgi:hypothetical protein
MAANQAAIRSALTRLGFSNQAATFINEDQEMDDLDEFALLTDDEVENMCKVVRKPGGTIENPNADVAGQPPTIPNPGIAITLRAENNLKLACYFLRYKKRTSRAVAPADITLESVRAYREYKKWEEEHKDVDPPEINAKDWPRTMDAIDEWLRGCLGVTKIPLAYVVRPTIAIPTNDLVAGYATKQDELIARAPIQGPTEGTWNPDFLADSVRVWEKLSDLTREHECWSYVRPAQRTRDGRLAYQGLRGHYLGVNNVDNMSAKAEHILQTTSYTGEKRRWNFEKYVRTHIDQHSILEGLKEHGYAGIDERSKVRHLIAGIKVASMDAVKTRILSDETLRSDFDACVNLYQDFLKQTSATIKEVTIATVQLEKKKGLKDPETPNMSVEDRYYKRKEYNALSAQQKLGLKLKREKRGHTGNEKGKKEKKKNSVELSQRMIKALATALCQETEDKVEVEESDESSEEYEEAKKPTKRVRFGKNRHHPALQRQKK